jgi:ATP-dependent RNA helicase DHX29
MAGAKKKKTKPTANPARGFATTSVASKVVARVENTDDSNPSTKPSTPTPNPQDTKATPTASSTAPPADPKNAPVKQELSPEEFERQLEESELQLLVEKHAQKVKRDAQRQKSRLETDRRLLRTQAESVNTRKWLPPELMDHILDIIQAESRFSSFTLGAENTSPGKLLPEEDLIMKLWTLQLTLSSAGFGEDKVKAVLRYVLDIAPNIGGAPKEGIWGLEEALDWLARECARDELPDYEQRGKTLLRPGETPQDSPLPSGATTPRLLELSNGPKPKTGRLKPRPSREVSPRKVAVTCDSDIEPDDLEPVYLETKAKLFHVQRPRQEKSKSANQEPQTAEDELKEAKLLAKVDRIEQDPLFDKNLAELKWRSDRIVLEQDYAAAKREKDEEAKKTGQAEAETETAESDDEIAAEAKKMAAEVLQQDSAEEEVSLSDLFASLPTEEVDPSTGKTLNVVNGSDGSKTFIRDFGKKWAGVSPMRALEEACRSR